MTQTAAEPKKNTSRKVKALLAGGLVLGVGAAVTLAAWTDQEWAEGIFGAGSFNIESSVTGDDPFTDNISQDGAATLAFDLTRAENMAPTDTVTAPFALRLDEDTTHDAEVTLESSSAIGQNAEHLTYGITQVASAAECGVGTSETTIVPTGTAMASTEGATIISLTAGADQAPGTPFVLCFEVTAGPNLIEGESATAHWEFAGTSTNE